MQVMFDSSRLQHEHVFFIEPHVASLPFCTSALSSERLAAVAMEMVLNAELTAQLRLGTK
jgi:hypothetical protein